MRTYLQMVNAVLKRMREEETTNVFSDSYTTLISTFVNDALEQVSDAHDWSAELADVVIVTAPGVQKYSLTNATERVKIYNVVNTTADAPGTLYERGRLWINERTLHGNNPNQRPQYWCNDGIDSNGDARIGLYPTPDEAETLTVQAFVKTPELEDGTDTILIPHKPVVLLALAFAVRERGEVGGTATAEYFELAKRSLSDAIAYDKARNDDESVWYTP